MQTYEDFRREDKITRAEIAKMLSVYAEDHMHLTPDIDRIQQCSSYNDLDQVNPELQSSIIQSCELGLMGYYADGKTVKPSFSPKDTITKAEIVTIISRMLR